MNTRIFREDPDYWDRKLANYLHDPPDKALRIPGHEARAQILRDLLHVPSPDETRYRRADWIASGMDRTVLPGYDADESRSGAVDFLKSPVVTHPTGAEKPLAIELRDDIDLAGSFSLLQNTIAKDVDELAAEFPGRREILAPARFHYIHHVLRKRLAETDVGSLGGLWYRMPADTRIPDHSIWQHCGLTSALCSCFESSPQAAASVLVFSITPVQQFISRARKLRDFWTSSLILSWLAFEGLRSIICGFGSDHILYPSVIEQPLVNRLLADELGLKWLLSDVDGASVGVASLPNKFVCLVPAGKEPEAASDIEESVREAWLDLGDITRQTVEKTTDRVDPYVSELFHNQLSRFWSFHWAACPLVDETRLDAGKSLLDEATWRRPEHFLKSAGKVFGGSGLQAGEGYCYGITHALSQSFLAAGKSRRVDHRQEEPGIKCSLNSEFEALRFAWKEGEDRNPRATADPFWTAVKCRWYPKSDFKPSERLSAPATVVRLAYRVCGDRKADGYLLSTLFKDAEGFPSTTEMALRDWLDAALARVEATDLCTKAGGWKSASTKLAQVVHGLETDADERSDDNEITDLEPGEQKEWRKLFKDLKDQVPLMNEDRYYAILLMDGDNMGRLVSGETLASTWESVLHPDLVTRFNMTGFNEVFAGFWKSELGKTRFLAPSVHAALSEALADFSIETVPRIVQQNKGKLIYAGGDDVCAVLPVSKAIGAAREIARRYSHGFCFLPSGEAGQPEEIRGRWKARKGRLMVHLGKGDHISISAAVLICHHKKPLSVAMVQAHDLLKKGAKDQEGKNALAVELDKRSGGSQRFIAQWEEAPPAITDPPGEAGTSASASLLDRFLSVGERLGDLRSRSLSASLIYRLELLRSGMEVILRDEPAQLVPFLAAQIERSGLTKAQTGSDKERAKQLAHDLARDVAALVARQTSKGIRLDTEGLLVAKFVGTCRAMATRRAGGGI